MAPPSPEPGDAILPDPQKLLQDYPLLGTATAVVVAYSGGLDSTVLLHLLASLRSHGLAPLQAIHVHHGLQAAAEAWPAACRATCEKFEVPLIVEHVTVDAGAAGASEEAARTARYAAFARHLPDGAVLVQAHHRQDQVETVLFRFLRGSGVRGLAGMPAGRRFAGGWLLRPLLGVDREALERHATRHQLSWVEDPSNTDPRYTRNFLRHVTLPSLREQWPALDRQVALTARHCRDATDLLDEVAHDDWQRAAGPHPSMLNVGALQALSRLRGDNLLRWWYRLTGGDDLPLPDAAQLDRIRREVVGAAPDANPVLVFGAAGTGLQLCRHRGNLYLVPPLPALPSGLTLVVGEELVLPAPLGTLRWEHCDGGLTLIPGERLELRARAGGEHIKLPGRPTRSLKNLLQELGVEPWLRDRVPLVYRAGELIAVADLAVAEQAVAGAGKTGMRLYWDHPDLHCGD